METVTRPVLDQPREGHGRGSGSWYLAWPTDTSVLITNHKISGQSLYQRPRYTGTWARGKGRP
jgi:hypothetical protein